MNGRNLGNTALVDFDVTDPSGGNAELSSTIAKASASKQKESLIPPSPAPSPKDSWSKLTPRARGGDAFIPDDHKSKS